MRTLPPHIRDRIMTFQTRVQLNMFQQTVDIPISVAGQEGTEQWAYTDVRPDAHMFWWLYYTTHPDGYLNRPLVIWLQVSIPQCRIQEFPVKAPTPKGGPIYYLTNCEEMKEYWPGGTLVICALYIHHCSKV